jgi:hypothetical protein
MPKCQHRVSLSTDLVDNAMGVTFLHAAGLSLDQIAQIDHEFIFERWKLDPLVRGGVPDLQTILTRLQQKNGQTAVVGMLTSPELVFVCKSVWWIFEKFEEPDKVSILIGPNTDYNNPKLDNSGFSAVEAAYRAMPCVGCPGRQANSPG